MGPAAGEKVAAEPYNFDSKDVGKGEPAGVAVAAGKASPEAGGATGDVEDERGADWRREKDPATQKIKAIGVQCTGADLNAYAGLSKDNGTQLSWNDGLKLQKALKFAGVKRPPPTYLVIKFLAEFLEVYADAELKAAALHGKDKDKRLPVLRILGVLNKSFVHADQQKVLETGKGGPMKGLPEAEIKEVHSAVKALPAPAQSKELLSGLKSRKLITLQQLSDIIYVLGKGLEPTEGAIHSALEALSQTQEPAIIGEEDVEHYYEKVVAGKNGIASAPLAILHFCPVLAQEFGAIDKGFVVLKRIHAVAGITPLAESWISIKVLALLYDVLSHMPGAPAEQIHGPPGTKWRLGCLGGLDRTFLTMDQRANIMKGKRATLDSAELDILKELSVASRFASIDPKRRVVKAARKIQKHILENYLFTIPELVELFSDMSNRFYIPFPLYKQLVRQLVKKEMIKESQGDEVLAKVSPDQKRRGIHLFDVVPHFTVAMESLTAEAAGEGSESGEGTSSGVSSTAEAVEEISPEGQDVLVPILLLHDFVILKKRGPRRSEFHMEAYLKALEYVERAPLKGDKKTGMGYLKSAVERKRPLPLSELSIVIGLCGTAPCIQRPMFNQLLKDLLREKLISKSLHDVLFKSTTIPIAPTALRAIFDRVIETKE